MNLEGKKNRKDIYKAGKKGSFYIWSVSIKKCENSTLRIGITIWLFFSFWNIIINPFLFSQEKNTNPSEKMLYIQLPEIIINSATLTNEQLFNIPYKVDVIQKTDSIPSLSRNTPNYLQFVPNINIQETAFGHGSPFIRGLTGFRNVYLIDGIRLNNSFFREGPNQYFNTIDSYLIDKIEIIKGPVSVLYGSDAMGGVISISTINPSTKKGIHEHSSIYFSSASSAFIERQEVHFGAEKFSFYIGGTLKNFNDLKGGKNTGIQPITGFNENDGDFKFIYKIQDKGFLTIAYQHTFQNDVPRTHRTIFAIPFRDTTIGQDKKAVFDQWRDLFYIQYRQQEGGSFFDELHSNLSYHRQKETFFRIDKNNKKELRWANIETIGNFLYFNSKTSIGQLTFGYDLYYDIVNSRGLDISATGTPTFFARGEVPDDATYLLSGLFVQDEYNITNRLKSISGIRLQYARATADKVDPNPAGTDPNLVPFQKDFVHIVPSQRFSYLLSERLNFILGISGGFRAPTFDDLAAVRLVMSGQTDMPSPNLSPEKSWNIETGIKYTNQKIYFSAFYFYNKLEDLIRRVAQSSPPNTFRKENFSNGFIQGVELDLEYNFYKRFYLYGNFGYLDSGADAISGSTVIRAPLDKIQPPILNIGIEYKDKKFSGILYIKAVGKKSPSQYSPSDKQDTQRLPPSGLPGYTIFNAGFNYLFKDNIKATLWIENIFDTDYRVVGSGQNSAGFNIISKIDISF